METTLRRIADTLGALRDAVETAWSEGAWSPESWPPTLAWWLLALAALLMLAALRRGRPRPLDVRPPQLLITQGEVVPDPDAGVPTRRRRPSDPSGAQGGTLAMTVSNLSRYPVQLLEVALRGESRGAPRVAEVEAVVPAMGAVEVVTRLPLGLQGDGWLDLYCYAAAPRHKTHRHRAELVWEPWAARFKVAPMEQVVTPARRLASDERNARFDLPAVLGEATVVAPAATAATVPPVEPRPTPVVAAPPASVPTPSATPVPAPPASARPLASRGAPEERETAREAPHDAVRAEAHDAVRANARGAVRAEAHDAVRAEARGAVRAGTDDAGPGTAAGDRTNPSLGALWSRLPRRGGRADPQAVDVAPGERGDPPAAAAGRADANDARDAGTRATDPTAGNADAAAPPVPTVRQRRRLEFPDEF